MTPSFVILIFCELICLKFCNTYHFLFTFTGKKHKFPVPGWYSTGHSFLQLPWDRSRKLCSKLCPVLYYGSWEVQFFAHFLFPTKNCQKTVGASTKLSENCRSKHKTVCRSKHKTVRAHKTVRKLSEQAQNCQSNTKLLENCWSKHKNCWSKH